MGSIAIRDGPRTCVSRHRVSPSRVPLVFFTSLRGCGLKRVTGSIGDDLRYRVKHNDAGLGPRPLDDCAHSHTHWRSLAQSPRRGTKLKPSRMKQMETISQASDLGFWGQYVQYAPWIDVLLALRTGFDSSACSISVPQEIVMAVAGIYFGLIRPDVSCGPGYMIMSCDGRDLVTFKYCSFPIGMFIDSEFDDHGKWGLSAFRQVNHHLQQMTGAIDISGAAVNDRATPEAPVARCAVTNSLRMRPTAPRTLSRLCFPFLNQISDSVCMRHDDGGLGPTSGLSIHREPPDDGGQTFGLRPPDVGGRVPLNNDDSQRISPGVMAGGSPWFDKRLNHIVCGTDFVVAVSDTGRFSWGGNYYGQLGLGDTIDRVAPVYVHMAYPTVAVACGDHHTLMIIRMSWRTSSRTYCTRPGGSVEVSPERVGTLYINKLYGWGRSDNGQLGTPDRAASGPIRAIDVLDPSAIACGHDYSLVLAGGCVYRLGDDDWRTRDQPSKLEYKDAIRIFVCCGGWRVWHHSNTSQHGVTSGAYIGPSVTSTVYEYDIRCYIGCRDSPANDCGCDDHRRFGTVCDLPGYDRLRCETIGILTRYDLTKLPGIILSVNGRDHYAVVTTTRGVFAIMERRPHQLLCLL
jgi:hypothetical protein